MKNVILAMVAWFCIVFFTIFLTVLGFKLAMAVVNNIVGVLV